MAHTNETKRMVIEDLWLGYDGKDYLLKAVNTGVSSGEMIALVGRNGTGKSTLLRTISGIQKPVRGTIRYNGKPLSSLTMRTFASSVSFVGTGHVLSENLTVYEMVSLGRHPYTNWWGTLRDADREKIDESLSFVGMESFAAVKVDRLSDGERQRVMIAMALAQDTEIIILDEPTAFLDIPNRAGIIDVLYKLREKGRTVVYSTHEFDNAFTHADRIWVIHEQTLYTGAPEDLGMAGTFDRIFSDAGVTFDSDNLRFIRSSPPDKQVRVSLLDPKVNYWTCRAMERIGYKMVTGEPLEGSGIEILRDGTGFVWVYHEAGRTIRFTTLYDLTGFLAGNG